MLKQFEGKVLILRYPSDSSLQQYDADGKVLTGGKECPWTTCGGILIDNVELSQEKVQLKGRRILFQFQPDKLLTVEYKKIKHRDMPYSFTPLATIEIKLNQPIHSEEEARSIFNRVFTLNTADFVQSAPPFWRDYLTDRVEYDPLQPVENEFSWHEPAKKQTKPDDQSSSTGDLSKTVFHVGKEVKAPKATHTPEPSYSEIARYEQLQGVVVLTLVVGPEGDVRNIRLVRPLGLGLEEMSQATVREWRFLPATRNGEPVAVEMNVEISFAMY